MALMMLFICTTSRFVRNVKDSLVVNAKGSDAEIISSEVVGNDAGCGLIHGGIFENGLLFQKRDHFLPLRLSFIAFFGFFAFGMYPNKTTCTLITKRYSICSSITPILSVHFDVG